jgi:hypothetical protein
MAIISFEENFGYYQVHCGAHSYRTCSKLEALQAAQRNNGSVSWHYNDEVYGSYDWSTPIQEDIIDLYRQRAEQLRSKFDHVVLMYSGGYDSHNMLESFLKNNIKVDAIVSFYNAMDPNNDSDIVVEWQLQTWPRLKPILEAHPEIEFIRMDMSRNSLNMLDMHKDDYYYISDGALAPNFVGISYLHQLLPAKFRTGSLAMVYGVDKPRVRYKNNQFIFNFYDQGFRVKPVTAGSGIEYFYWSADLPKLAIKQAQIAKNFWSGNFELMQTHSRNKRNPDLGVVLDHDHAPLQRMIYPHCSHGVFLTWRPASVTFGQRDIWIYKSNTEYKDKIMDMYKSFKKNVDRRWFNQGRYAKGLIGRISRDYIL